MSVNPLDISCKSDISDQFTLVFTGLSRSASEVLEEEPHNPEDKLSRMRKIRSQADLAEQYLEASDLYNLRPSDR